MSVTGAGEGKGHTWSLLRDFARLLLLAVVLPVALLTGLNLWQGARAAREEYGHRLDAAADLAARDVDNLLQTYLSALRLLAERRSASGALHDTGGWAADLERTHRNYPDFSSLAVVDASGRLLLVEPATPGARGRSVGDRSYFLEPRRTGEAHVSDAYRGRIHDDVPSFALSAPLRVDGKFAGVVGGAIALDAFRVLRDQSSLTRGFEMLLLDRSLNVVHATAGVPHAPLDSLNGSAVDAPLRALINAPRGVTYLPGVLREGGDAYGTHVGLRSGWHLLVMVPEDTVIAEVRRNNVIMLALLAMVLLGVLGVAGAQMRRLGAYVRELLERMQRFALDGTDSGPDPTRELPQELAPLAQALNQLSARAREAYGAVTTSLEDQQRLHGELQAATRQLLTAQEDERNAISRELHDDIGQQITAIKLGATALREESDPAQRAQILDEIEVTADETVAKLRNLSLLLRPPQLDSMGVEASLRWHAERIFRTGRTRLSLELSPLEDRPDPAVELATFRIAQEALTNVLRHSDAAHVVVALASHDEGRALRLTVTDDGEGLLPGQPPGLGLVTMRERAQQLGGQLHVHGERGHGTVVEAILPMRPQVSGA
ncbi:histidine kinase [Agrilutibacter solisilvae]|uniref:histidine kinase n=1 Tax=Agrilutibacter solisilvae TaxID=2763317 RepID=A0A974XXG3_9GAMM|nr:histidine kinase [Lysobacter solisilvae]QSX77579.1 hypothetical protein I8J32_012575 [Lysobacter solisilvae]